MAARRCGICSVDWPVDNRYSSCPHCGEKTDWVGKEDAMTREEAESICRRLDFERFYDERGERDYRPESKQRAKEWDATLERIDRQLAEARQLKQLAAENGLEPARGPQASFL